MSHNLEVGSSVTRCWSLKVAQSFQTLPKYYKEQFFHKISLFEMAPKVTNVSNSHLHKQTEWKLNESDSPKTKVIFQSKEGLSRRGNLEYLKTPSDALLKMR